MLKVLDHAHLYQANSKDLSYASKPLTILKFNRKIFDLKLLENKCIIMIYDS